MDIDLTWATTTLGSLTDAAGTCWTFGFCFGVVCVDIVGTAGVEDGFCFTKISTGLLGATWALTFVEAAGTG